MSDDYLTISRSAFLPEEEAVLPLLASLSDIEASEMEAIRHAARLVQSIRRKGTAENGVEAFMQRYGLTTREGVAVMCLAEALLRIPDSETADALIRDKLSRSEWERYLGNKDSLFVNAATWGLMLSGDVIRLEREWKGGIGGVLGTLVSRLGEPVIREALRQAMKIIGTQFVMGKDIGDALKRSEPLKEKGYRFSYDILGEGARTDEQAQAYVKAYRDAITRISRTIDHKIPLYDRPGISIKLSALHARYQLVKKERVMQELLPRLVEIVREATAAGITVALDAEEASRLDISLQVFEALLNDNVLAKAEGIGFVVQAYQKRAPLVIDWLTALARRQGRRIPVRLVKGAYWDAEIKQSQVLGLGGYPVYTRKCHTDVSYLACAKKMLAAEDALYPQFATHNAHTVATIIRMGEGKQFEFQRLYGMGSLLYNQMLGDYPCRIYAPVGKHEDLLAYLIRRLLENGANTSFVHLIADPDTPVETIVASPLRKTRKSQGKRALRIPLPEGIYGEGRQNSAGYDLGNLAQLEDLRGRLSRKSEGFRILPLIAGLKQNDSVTTEDITFPADRSHIVGQVSEATKAELSQAIAKADEAYMAWSLRPVEERSAILRIIASRMEAEEEKLLRLCVYEAGKTWADAIAELREAIDFCRFYASEAERLMSAPLAMPGPTGESNELSLHGRGVFACISPWNFPLAIFTGQVVAALVTGNCVIAKPSEQTVAIAHEAVRIMHEAGIPEDVLQLVIGPGSTIGAAMVADPRVIGVTFTGSTATAKHIARSLAEKDGPIGTLIAETGGLNTMLVDSSALLEQVTDDVVTSAFGSAGQRCSALRLLFVQEEIADRLIAMIAGAMRELTIGSPADPATDIGPVIDEEAQSGLLAHIERMKKEAKLVYACEIDPDIAKKGTYVAPHAFELKNASQLTEEQFGPILHIVRYKAADTNKVMEDIRRSGYGLTMGVQSRIESFADRIVARAHVGNIYVNRSMIGATVGVQPFGGEGLSGTGPKAGGPYYLLRFCTERTVTINTAAIGGNLELLK